MATRQLEPTLPDSEITRVLAALCCFEVDAKDTNLVLDAHLLACMERLRWFEALIAEAVLGSRCNCLFCEDFGHGRVIGALPGPAFAVEAAGLWLLQLKRRLGSLSVQRETTLGNLPAEQLWALAEALLNFQSAADL